MNEIFEKTRELGEALLRSEEYKNVKIAENRAMANQDAADTVSKFLELRGQMEQLMSAPEKDWNEVQQVSEQIDACRQRMDAIEDLIALNKARTEFDGVINQINAVLHFIVTGEMSNTEEGCTGSCATCHGCSTVN